MSMINKIIHGDCLEVMKKIPDKKIDMILCDLPYGTTACKWDVIIPFEPLWEQYKRVIKKGGAIALFGREPFTSLLVMSNLSSYKHKWIWNKKQSGTPHNAKYMPLQIDEDIIIFCAEKVNYYPKMRKGKMRKRGGYKQQNATMRKGFQVGFENESDLYYPINIIEFANPRTKRLHPTQKPLEVCEILIENYTNENDIVLDNCIGSGTTAIACMKTNRRFVGIEKDLKYVEIARKRIEEFADGS